MPKPKAIEIETNAGTVSGLLDMPSSTTVRAAVTLAHGAGAGMQHAFMADLAAALAARGFAVLRFQFPYMEAGSKRPDSPAIAAAAVASAVAALRKRVRDVPIFAAGKSFGARMTTTAAARGLLPDLAGILCYGFPLHPAGKPGITRAEHLSDVPVPMLFLQGTRDALADLGLIEKVCAKLPRATLKIVEGADHGFAVLKRSGRTPGDVRDELATESESFMEG